jgi:hypothetical protein
VYPLEKANIFNDHFTNICAQNSASSSNVAVPNNGARAYPPLMCFEPTSSEEIKEVILSLKPGSASGYDGIKAKFIKKNVLFFSEILCQHVNDSFGNGVFPDALKVARVVPIHKDGSTDDLNNYRPISVLSVFSKIFEILIRKRLDSFLQTNNIISKNQFGFLKKSSTSSAASNLVNEITSRINSKLKTACLFVDLRKAFDCLRYSTLSEILHNIGIRGHARLLLMSYLSNRQQFVACDGAQSSLKQVLGGIPQGSVLGPLLFLLYINGIFDLKLNGSVQLYADDMALVYGQSQFHLLKKNMCEDLSILIPWLSSINFTINFKKTKFIIFRSARTDLSSIFLSINFHNNTIHSTPDYDYLGLTIDQRLTWSNHVAKIARKIAFYVYQLRRIRHSINKKTLEMIYSAYIKSHLTYLLPLWGSAADVHMKCLQVLQNKAIKFLRFLPSDTPSQSLYGDSMLSMRQLYRYESAFLIHKMHKNLIKCNFPLTDNFSITGRNTRSASHLRIPHFLTVSAQRTLFYNGLQIYNSVPDSIKSLRSVSEFKSMLRAHVSRTIPPIHTRFSQI